MRVSFLSDYFIISVYRHYVMPLGTGEAVSELRPESLFQISRPCHD